MTGSMSGGEGTNLSYRRIPNNVCRCYLLQEVELNSPLLECRLLLVIELPKDRIWKEKSRNVTLGHLANTT